MNVREQLKATQSSRTNGAQPAPPPTPAGPPPPLGELLDDAAAFIRRFVVMNDTQLTVIALFIAHSWAIDGAAATPYLLVRSPQKRSGKTRLLETLELLVARPWRVVSASEAAMFRKLDQDRPTLLLDEIDAIFGPVKSDRNEALRSILNAGNRRGSFVPRCVGEGSKQSSVDFSVFGAKVLAGINNRGLPDTIEDRAVTIEMVRKTSNEHAERFRYRYANDDAEPIRAGFQVWASEEVLGELHDADPEMPGALNDRVQEAVEPLLAIADQAGGDWPARARASVRRVCGGAESDDSHGPQALAIIRTTLGDRHTIASADLLDALNEDDEAPFGGWRKGLGIDARGLARLLKPYAISPKKVRIDGETTAKGYRAEQFEDTFSRYLPPRAASKGNKGTNLGSIRGNGHFQRGTTGDDVPLQNGRIVNNDGVCSLVPLPNPSEGEMALSAHPEDLEALFGIDAEHDRLEARFAPPGQPAALGCGHDGREWRLRDSEHVACGVCHPPSPGLEVVWLAGEAA